MIFRVRLFMVLAISALPLLVLPAPQEARVNQKKIEREHQKKQKEAQRQYEQALKRHRDNQSKATKKSMKRSKKEAKNTIPVKR